MREGRQRADILYTEADGVWIHLQREDQKHHEVKCGIVYRGWRRMALDRYELVGKRVYSHGDDCILFWEGVSLEWAKHYALDRVKLFMAAAAGSTGYAAESRSWATRYSNWTGSTCPEPVVEAMADRSERLSTTQYTQARNRSPER